MAKTVDAHLVEKNIDTHLVDKKLKLNGFKSSRFDLKFYSIVFIKKFEYNKIKAEIFYYLKCFHKKVKMYLMTSYVLIPYRHQNIFLEGKHLIQIQSRYEYN